MRAKSVLVKKFELTLFCMLIMGVCCLTGKTVCTAASTKIPNGYTPIYTIEDLYGINDDLNGNYILMNDIDLSETKPGGDWDAGNGWTPIGTNMSDNSYCDSFSGIFDGNGYRIKNMTIYGEKNPMCIGLFASIWEGTVKNLALEDIDIFIEDGKNYDLGAIAGRNGGTIESCYVTGDIRCRNANTVGGIVGDSRGKYANIESCYSDIDIILSEYFGGTSGGIAGFHYNGGLINCYALGNIELKNGDIEIKEHVGAIECTESAYGYAKNCYYMGNVSDRAGKKLSKAQMKSAKCFTGFDFKNTWVVDKNSPYPYPQLQSCMQVRTESIELLSEPDKTSYYTTDKLDLAGSELKINYEDNYSVTVPLNESMLSYKMKEGTQTVKVSYNGCTAKFDIDVEKATESLKITAKKTNLKVGSSYTYKAKYVGDGKLTFTSSNPKILKINKTTGKAVAKKAGTVTITVKAGTLTQTIKVKVVK